MARLPLTQGSLFSLPIRKALHSFLLAIVLLTLSLQGFLPLWRDLLQFDTWAYYERIEYFYQHKSFYGLETQQNEYLPASLLILTLPQFVLLDMLLPYRWFL